MYKLQVVLVPPSTETGIPILGIPSTTSDNTQLTAQPHQQPISASSVVGARNDYSPNTGNTSTNTVYFSSFLGSHIRRPKYKKFLHFTKPTNSLYQLAEEIVEKCNKMYPNLLEEPEIVTLQDINECDLDPDFVVKDVFNMDNTVRVVLKNELDPADENDTNTIYLSKKRKLNNGIATTPVSSTSTTAVPSSMINVVKKRATTLKNSALRVSTPLANQIYPPPAEKQVNSDFEDDDVADKSILPPPPPQSPPIRISSGIDQKRVKANENTVSMSETVDPNKARQQRLPSGTPIRPASLIETPNRVNLTGPTVLSESTLSQNKHTTSPMVTNIRITSGMLQIPEPRISEIERELKEGPASPAVDLPAKSNRIPMKKPYNPIDQQDEDVSSSSSSAHEEATRPVHLPNGIERRSSQAIRQSSSTIADDNGSPNRSIPFENGVAAVTELPSPRKSSLEQRVDKLTKGKNKDDNATGITRKDHFSDEESEASQNGSVVVNRPETRSEKGFQKAELLKILNSKRFELPTRFQHGTQEEEQLGSPQSRNKKKPYLTVLNKDIDNSTPDPRNILPRRTQRHAAQKAAQFISKGKSRKEQESESAGEAKPQSEPTSDGGSATDESEGVFLNENNSFKKLNIHPLKESVVHDDSSSLQSDSSSRPRTEDDKPSQEIDKEQVNNPSVSPGPSASKTVPIMTPTLLSSTSDRSEFALPKKFESTFSTPKMQQLAPAKKVESTQKRNATVINKNSEATQQKAKSASTKVVSAAAATTTTVSKNSPSSGSDPTKVNTKKVSSEVDAKSKHSPMSETDTITKSPNSLKKANFISNFSEDNVLNHDKPILLKTIGKKKTSVTKHTGSKQSPVPAKKLNNVISKEKFFQTPEFIESSEDDNEDKSSSKSNINASQNFITEPVKASKRGRSAKNTMSEPNKSSSLNSAELKKSVKDALDNAAAAASKMINEKLALAEAEPTLSPAGSVSKLDELRSKFAKGRVQGNNLQKQNKNGTPTSKSPKHVGSSISDNESKNVSYGNSSADESSDESSTDDEDTTMVKKSRRGIVQPPKGAVAMVSKSVAETHALGLETTSQSKQDSKKNFTNTNNRGAPLTKFMEQKSPTSSEVNSSRTESTGKVGTHRSLGSLSDLASRGVPEVREKSAVANNKLLSNQPIHDDSSSEESEDDLIESESESDSDESSSDGDESSDDGNNFISASSASKALGKKKKSNSGFASLLRDSQKK
ncbi:Net1p Ecym_6323 [Eremothecium cymbalariae DBVPG|uniref:Nucleolar protein Dnt1-like N-terminal domain-containing protein n=1 Tax=Eremothecium cymbalariae (strain CBS 270.75 / DBVPG 7215 / KCTC 17166 / NRRL Y-17582) TaxID=931890 RepID=G8JUB9_ERECY|nr:hypothetical protein Ecym_6323 [Eremothecium cymbalariae DBVPG\